MRLRKMAVEPIISEEWGFYCCEDDFNIEEYLDYIERKVGY